jgi:hypothetical protein
MEIHKWNRLDCKRTAQRTNKVQELQERTEKGESDIVKKGGAEGGGAEWVSSQQVFREW